MLTITADLESCRKMRPQIEPGDILKVEKGAPITAKDIAFISIENKPMFAMVEFLNCGVWVVFSNPAYDAVYIPPEEIGKLNIIGKVTERTRRYK